MIDDMGGEIETVTMIRLDNRTGEMEERQVVAASKDKKLVSYLHATIPKRICQESARATKHSYHKDRKTALAFLVTLKEAELEETVALTIRIRKDLGKYRKEYRTRYARGTDKKG